MIRTNRLTKLECAVLAGIVLTLVFTSLTAFASECSTLRGEVLRLHILANSDSESDQAVKLQLRDHMLLSYGTLFAPSPNKESAKAAVKARLPEIKRDAERFLSEIGCPLSVETELVEMYFETRSYDELTLPAGLYDAVRLSIGTGGGKNWWCVLYPPICVPAATSKEERERLASESVAGKSPKLEPRFALVELLEGVKEKLTLTSQEG